jgi:hypothetical protein
MKRTIITISAVLSLLLGCALWRAERGAHAAALAPLVVNSTADGQVSEVQQITVSGDSGTFTLTFNGQTTGPLFFGAYPFFVESYLNGLPTIGGVGGRVRVTQSGNIYTVVFGGSLAATNVPQLTGTGSEGATVSVTTLQDALLNCPGLNCTLRGAIAAAAAGGTIQFGPLFNTPQTITLTSGDLYIEKSLTIQGPGAKLLAVNGNNASRVFTIPRGLPDSDFIGTPYDVTISGLTVTGGNAMLSSYFGFLGGGLGSANNGTLNLVEMVFTGNTAGDGQGGGLEFDGYLATINLIRSTVHGNTASNGGGINIRGIITLNVTNSTIAQNTAMNGYGGGIAWSINQSGLINLVNSTVAGNQANWDGGISSLSTRGVVTARNSIIALNTAPNGPDFSDSGVFISQGYNLIGAAPGGFAVTQPTDKLGVNPLLELDGLGQPRLTDNGGPTPTITLLPGSPAIDLGSATPYHEAQFINAFNTSGTFALTFNGQTTSPLPFNATGAQVEAALNALPSIGGIGGYVTVVHSVNPSFGGYIDLRSLVLFGGALADANLPLLTVTNSTLDNYIEAQPVVDGGPLAAIANDQRGFPRPVDQLSVSNAPGGNGTDAGAVELPCLPITLGTLAPVQAGVPYNGSVAANLAGASYSLLTGSLPPGLNLNPATGQLSGLATATGTYNFTIRTVSASSCNATQAYTLAVTCPTITLNPAQASLPGGTVGTAYSQTLSATPAGNYSFAKTSGALPPGLTLSAAGSLSGNPTTQGTYTFTVTATGFGICTGSRSYTVVITANCAAITLPALPAAGTVNVNYSGNLAATTPAASYTFSVESGSLPPGLTINNLFGQLSGKPAAAGTYNFTLKATRSNGCSGTREYTVTISGGAALRTALARTADYDGDGKSDLSLWSSANGAWQIVRSSDEQTTQTVWGAAGDVTLLGDYDGDGLSDLAVFRPSNGTWYVKQSSGGPALVKAWGASTDVPVPGDYDGDGQTDLAVWRPSEGNWYVLKSSDGGYEIKAWGLGVAPYLDVPVPGDYDGDGKTDLAVFRRSSGTWLIQRSADGQYTSKTWGVGSDVPVAGDYDGDGRSDLAVWRGATGQWFVLKSSDQSYEVKAWGAAAVGDVPVAGDYDGDGRADLAVWRAPASRWYLFNSATAEIRSPEQGPQTARPVAARIGQP